MKRVIVLGAMLGVGFGLGVVFVGVPIAVRAGVGSGAVVNGDTNGDGGLDISDAVYLLVHLFKGGPEPVACADSPGLVDKVVLLEGKVAALEARASTDREDVEALIAKNDRTVFWARNLSYSYLVQCEGAQNGDTRSGPVTFTPNGGSPISMIRNAALENGQIVFRTTRKADLLLTSRYGANEYWGPLELDGVSIEPFFHSGAASAGVSGHPQLLSDVEPGVHVLGGTVNATCRAGFSNPAGQIPVTWIMVEYLE